MVMLAATGATATAAGRDGGLTDTGIARGGYESVSTGNDTLHGKAGLRIASQRIVLHALLKFESARFFAVLLRDRLIDVGRHGADFLTLIPRLGKANPLTIQFACGKIGRQGGGLFAACHQFNMFAGI